jgi:hypothetical protein
MTGAKVKLAARVNKQLHSEVAVVVRELEKVEEQERDTKVGFRCCAKSVKGDVAERALAFVSRRSESFAGCSKAANGAT